MHCCDLFQINGGGVKMSASIPRQWLYPICNNAYRCTLATFADVRVENRERIPRSGPLIVVCNHVSNLDPPTVATALPRPPIALAKRELFGNRFFSFLLRGWGAHPVTRHSADIGALSFMRRVLQHDRTVMMFPEGTRSRDNEGLRRGHIGAALLASWTGAPVLPIGIHGTERMQVVLRTVVPTGKIVMSMGQPFKVNANPRDRNELRAATHEVMYRIANQLPIDFRGAYADCDAVEFKLTKVVD